MTDKNVFEELVVELENAAKELQGELEAYREGEFKNKSAAGRARKVTLALDKIGKEFRKTSVAFHK